MSTALIQVRVPKALATATRHVLLDREETLSEALRPVILAEMERIVREAQTEEIKSHERQADR